MFSLRGKYQRTTALHRSLTIRDKICQCQSQELQVVQPGSICFIKRVSAPSFLFICTTQADHCFLVMRRPIYYVDADYSLTRSDTVVLFSTSFCICWDTSSRWTTSSSSDSWTARLPDTLSSDTLTVCFISVVHRMHTHSYFLQVSRLRLAPWDKVSRTLSV